MAPVGVSSSLLVVWNDLDWVLRMMVVAGVVLLRRRVRAVMADSWRAAIVMCLGDWRLRLVVGIESVGFLPFVRLVSS